MKLNEANKLATAEVVSRKYRYVQSAVKLLSLSYWSRHFEEIWFFHILGLLNL
jgi:hypothetical protein